MPIGVQFVYIHCGHMECSPVQNIFRQVHICKLAVNKVV